MIPAVPKLRVLIYQENEGWIAHLLEMDLVGTGATQEEAEAELVDAFEAQLSYCTQNKLNPFFPAPPEIFAMWEETQREELASLVTLPEGRTTYDRRASIVSPPSRESRNSDGWLAQPCFG
jgi:predicted RNA binding protein YcfA (HicA-like mRNA interferase family)